MSDRALSRHRAPQRAVTPLTEMTDAITGQIAVVGRSGVIVAMSTGLVASVAAPTQALANTSASSTRTAHTLAAGRSSVPLGSANLARGTMVSAPNTAIVTFDTAAFKAAPARTSADVTTTTTTATTTKARSISRSVSRSKVPTVKRASVPARSGSSIIAIASRYVGIPYVYGGTTPRGFDCSGFTRYVYRQAGVSLPRTANAQMQATKRISRSQARAGDLVFFLSGGRAYHTGIYAGHNKMYDSPRSGKTLQKREIWSASVVFARA